VGIAGEAPDDSRPTPVLDEAAFLILYERLRDSASWGRDDRRGALNNLTATRVAQAAEEIRSGRTVSLAAAVENEVSLDNPDPCQHRMTGPSEPEVGSTLQFSLDRLAMNIHGNADSHLDALSHVLYQGTMYNGVSADKVGVSGAAGLSLDVARDGIVGRGVLLDIPRVEGRRWLEPGESVTAEALATAETAQHVTVRPGDLLFVRVGHRPRRDHYGPWDAAQARAGLHPTAMQFLPSAGSPCLAATATTTPRRVWWPGWGFRCTCSRSTPGHAAPRLPPFRGAAGSL
jgi:Putative cyclase